jgi:hypothetical protein
MLEKNKKHSEFLKSEIIVNGEVASISKEIAKKTSETILKPVIIDGVETTIAKERSKKAASTKLSKKWKETKGKLQKVRAKETKQQLVEYNGELMSIQEMNTLKRLETMQTPFILNGEETTISLQAGKKQSELKQSDEWKKTSGKVSIEKCKDTMNDVNWKKTIGKNSVNKRLKTMNSKVIYNGVEMTIQERSALKLKETNKKKYPTFNVYHIEKGLLYENLSLKEVKGIHYMLPKTCEENYIGKHPISKAKLIKYGKVDQIGLYVEKISE